MSDNKVAVSEAVMERVNAEIVKSILETPDYIQSIVTELLKEPQQTSSYNDPDRGKPLFEVLMRRQIRNMVDQSVTQALRDRYKGVIDEAVTENIQSAEMLEGSLAQAFSRVINSGWKLTVDTNFKFEPEKD